MEQNFQTSFIPKKPMIEERTSSARPVGMLLVVPLVILFTVIIAWGGLYLYKGALGKEIVKMDANLNLAKNRFEPARIAELQVLDKRLRASNEILTKHITVVPIFRALENLTMKTVRYTKLDYTQGTEKSAPINVKMKGVAIGYQSIALQSDIFTTNKNIIDPVFSNLTLDNSGNVIFDLDFQVDLNFVSYKQNVSTEVSGDQQNQQ